MKKFLKKIALPGLFLAAALAVVVGLALNSQIAKAQTPVDFPWNNEVVLAAMAAETPQDAVALLIEAFLTWDEADRVNLSEAVDLGTIVTNDTEWWLIATDWLTTDIETIPCTPVRNDFGYGVWMCQGEAIHSAPYQGVAIRLREWLKYFIPLLIK